MERSAVMDGGLMMTPDQRRGAASSVRARATKSLYTPEQRVRRDTTRWTLVQGVLAPIQFLVFAISVVLVLRSLITGNGIFAAHASIIVKTMLLYTIMVTGAIWEKVVFGQYLFADAFFWEDVVSFVVIAIHTVYLLGLFSGRLSTTTLFLVALCAYSLYVVNAVQFVLKLRAARLQEARDAAQRVTVPA